MMVQTHVDETPLVLNLNGPVHVPRNPYDYSRAHPPRVTLQCLLKPEPPERRYADPDPKALVHVKVDRESYARADALMRQTFDTLIKTNIVCTARFSRMEPIEEIAWHLCGTYDRSVFPSCIGASENPKASWTAFRQGYIRCAGGNTREKAQLLIYSLCYRLHVTLRMPFMIYNFSVQNNVSAVTLPYTINLEKLQQIDAAVYKYEPDLFPGLICRMQDPKLVVQIFDSGKWNLVGAKSIRDPIRAITLLEPIVRRCRIHSCVLATRKSLEQLLLRDTNEQTRHPSVLNCERTYRKSKKNDKLTKEATKKRKHEAKALQDRKLELEKAIKKAKRNDGKAQQSQQQPQQTEVLYSDLSMHERDLMMIQERQAGLPSDDGATELEKITVLVYQIQTERRVFAVELMHNKTLAVLDADDEHEYADALQQCMRIFA